MTPEHTDRDLRERIAKLRDRIRCISATTCLMDIAELFAQVADDLDAALTASEGPRVCPTCGSDDPAKNWCVIYGDDVYIGGWGDEAFVQGSARIALGTVTAYRCPDSTAFHGIEASEGGSATPEQEVRGERARAQLLEDVHRAADDVRGHWGIENTEGYDEAMSDLALALDVLTAAERDGSVPATPTPPEQSHPRGRSAELLPDPQHPNQKDPNA